VVLKQIQRSFCLYFKQKRRKPKVRDFAAVNNAAAINSGLGCENPLRISVFSYMYFASQKKRKNDFLQAFKVSVGPK